MNRSPGFGFMEGLMLGVLVGAVVALFSAPASGATTRRQIRDESLQLKKRSQTLGRDALHQAKNIVKPTQPRMADAQPFTDLTLQEQTLPLEGTSQIIK
jgi:gas vesicle protein